MSTSYTVPQTLTVESMNVSLEVFDTKVLIVLVSRTEAEKLFHSLMAGQERVLTVLSSTLELLELMPVASSVHP